MMPLHIITIVLDGMPCITWHLPVFNRLNLDWTWHIVHGAADNVACTSWCSKPEPRLSTDGTSQYLYQIAAHPRIRVYEKNLWPGKVSMFREATWQIREPCCLIEIDSDELWEPWQIESIVTAFAQNPNTTCARFFCEYLVGQNIRTIGENCYGNNPGEWLRAWNYKPGMNWEKHEPPILTGANGPNEKSFSREETRKAGLVFWHYAYAFPQQLSLKEKYYKYPNALAQWQRLQTHPGPWPVKLRNFLPWVDDHAMANLIHT